MKSQSSSPAPSYSLLDLCELAGLSVRTARYYVQVGLVDRPEGETRAARYGAKQLEQLLLIKKWSAAGVSLERIGELLQGEAAPVPPRPKAAGSVDVRSHLTVADGVEVVIEPGRTGLTPEQLRNFFKGVMVAFNEAAGGQAAPAETEQQTTKGQDHGTT